MMNDAFKKSFSLAAVVCAVVAMVLPSRALADANQPNIELFWINVPGNGVDSAQGNAFLQATAWIDDIGWGANYLKLTCVAKDANGEYDFTRKIVSKWLVKEGLATGTSQDGEYFLLIRVPAGTPPGNYHVYSFELFDAAGNSTKYFRNAQNGENGLPAWSDAIIPVYQGSHSSTPPSSASDSLPPKFNGMDFLPKRVDVTNGNAFVDIYIHAEDDFSGLEKVDTWFMSQDGSTVSEGGYGKGSERVVYGELHRGVFYLRVTIPKNAPAGYWSIGGVLQQDRSGKTKLESPELPTLMVTNGDSDGDGTPGVSDEFPFDPSEWSDNDKDGIGDNADTDDDNDQLPDEWERRSGTNALVADNLEGDADNDGLDLRSEYEADTLPNNPDTDGDGYLDGAEKGARTNPRRQDSHPGNWSEGTIEDGRFKVKFFSRAGYSHRILGSNDFKQWVEIQGGIPGDGKRKFRWIDLDVHDFQFFKVETE